MLNSKRTFDSDADETESMHTVTLFEEDKAKVEVDNFDLLCVIFQGIGCVVIVSAVFTDLSFFLDAMPNAGLAFIIPLTLNVPQVVGQLFAIKYLSRMPLKTTVITITLIAAGMSAAIPGFVLTEPKFGLTLIAMCYFGIFMALINSIIVGYVSSIQDKRAMSMFMLGSGINSLVILVVQIVCMTALTKYVIAQSFMYFGLTAILFLICTASFIRLTKKFPIHECHEIHWYQIKQVYSEIWPEAISITLVYMVSLSVYPGLLLQLSWWGYTGPWMSVLVIGYYNIWDCIGRFIPSFVQSPSKQTLRWLSVARLLLIGTILMAMPYGIEYLQLSNWYSIVNVTLVAVTNGYVGTFVMIQGCSSSSQSEVGGYIMAFHLTLGLALGSIVAVILVLSTILY